MQTRGAFGYGDYSLISLARVHSRTRKRAHHDTNIGQVSSAAESQRPSLPRSLVTAAAPPVTQSTKTQQPTLRLLIDQIFNTLVVCSCRVRNAVLSVKVYSAVRSVAAILFVFLSSFRSVMLKKKTLSTFWLI